MGKLLAIIRDIFLCYILFILVQIAFNETKTFVLEHKESVIHELDRSFLDHLYTAQRQLHALEQHPLTSDSFASSIAELKNKIATLEEQYKKNSPGLALLGPIGTAAIITKEEQLQKKLLSIINDMGNIIHAMTNTHEQFIPAETISNGLQFNKKCIKFLIS